MRLVKCGICGKEVPEAPKITENGRCSVCKMQLMRLWDLPKEEIWGKPFTHSKPQD